MSEGRIRDTKGTANSQINYYTMSTFTNIVDSISKTPLYRQV